MCVRTHTQTQTVRGTQTDSQHSQHNTRKSQNPRVLPANNQPFDNRAHTHTLTHNYVDSLECLYTGPDAADTERH